MAKDILDAVYGCLIGGAVGDALGGPIEGWYYDEIKQKYGRLDRFIDYWNKAGQVTDDTTMRHIMCLAIARKAGRITPDDFAQALIEKLNPKRVWVNEHMMLIKLKQGMNPWDTGRGAIPSGCASMCIAPVGIINAGNPAQAYQDGFNISQINEEDIDRDLSATLAAANAAAFIPGATVESVIEAMFQYSSFKAKRALELTMDLAYSSSSVDEFAAKFYAKMLDWTWPQENWKKDRFFSGSSIEFVPVIPALMYLCKGDPNKSIIEGANFGRDCDTIGSLVGNLVGILHGASAIRKDWIDECEKANEDMFEEMEGSKDANFYSMAVRLVEALKKERQCTQERVYLLDKILE